MLLERIIMKKKDFFHIKFRSIGKTVVFYDSVISLEISLLPK